MYFTIVSWLVLSPNHFCDDSIFEKFAKHVAIKPIDVTGFCIEILGRFKNIDLPSL